MLRGTLIPRDGHSSSRYWKCVLDIPRNHAAEHNHRAISIIEHRNYLHPNYVSACTEEVLNDSMRHRQSIPPAARLRDSASRQFERIYIDCANLTALYA